MTEESNEISKKDRELDLIFLTKIFVNNKKTIYKLVFIFALIGLFLAIFTPKEYQSNTIFVPQGADNKKVGGSLGGLASLAGINIGNGAAEAGIPLTLYPEIVNSIPFQRELLQTKLTINGEVEKITYEDFYTKKYKPGVIKTLKKYTIGLPGVIMNAFSSPAKNIVSSDIKSDSIYILNSTENSLMRQLRSQISIEINGNDNYISINANMPEARPAAELAYNTKRILEKYIINYKIKKSSSKLSFINKRFKEKEKVFKEKQIKLASFQDRNRYSNSSRSQARLLTLQSEFDLAYSVFSELAQQLEAQKIQVKEDTPIFATIKPVSVPTSKIKPQRGFIFFSSLIFGALIGFLFVSSKELIKYYKEKIAK